MLKTILFSWMVWLIISGIKMDIYLFLGVISVAITCTIATKLKLLKQHQLLAKKLNAMLAYKKNQINYIPWLIWQNIISSFFFLKLAWSKKINIEGKIIELPITKLSTLTEQEKTAFTNSVTFTPGTCTVFIKENSIFIHTITDEMAEGIYDILQKIRTLN
ncbi:Na+/H+ antiporter subunit E [Anaplasmataceae bacterium AB001_6]|nr:Na+/H+ antiporter subunit E [Anaplasmataceae bacterium AB001_6]